VHLVQGDLAHLGLAGLDMRAQQQGRLIGALALDGPQDLAVFLVSGVDTRLMGEVEPADDADALTLRPTAPPA
jgi:hypothetical protein